jgi:hypothetical protein
MKIQIVKHTGELETITVDQKQEDGSIKPVDVEQEILETVQEADYTEDTKQQVMKAAALRAAMLSRDTGFRHVVKTVE